MCLKLCGISFVCFVVYKVVYIIAMFFVNDGGNI